jgi:putative ABC transport system permease protein
MLDSFRSVINALTLALAAIAAISLAVAGIGIMDVMLVSVSERVAEVGLLKALGARERQIRSLFVMEALILSGSGAILGLLLGAIAIQGAAHVRPDLSFAPSPTWVAIILAFTLAAGAVFGMVPARRAARLPAADALRGRR